jgi:hypothetical protein
MSNLSAQKSFLFDIFLFINEGILPITKADCSLEIKSGMIKLRLLAITFEAILYNTMQEL